MRSWHLGVKFPDTLRRFISVNFAMRSGDTNPLYGLLTIALRCQALLWAAARCKKNFWDDRVA
jgi:hypothetical protein